MCTVVVSIEPDQPVLLAGVRDELTDRAWIPPGRHWQQYQGLVGGQDLQAGGTWLAISPADLRVACVLNGIGRPAPPASRRSRGVLPLIAASGQSLDRGMLADIDPFLLVIAEPERALVRTWDGRDLAERPLATGLHMVVNSGVASYVPAADPDVTDVTGPDLAGEPPPDGREHEVARVRHFLARFGTAARPDPRPGPPVAMAWGDWFPLVNGNGIGPDDQRALIVLRDLGGGRTWGTTSISLVAMAPGQLRYDFTGGPGNETAWQSIL
jgi:transport and Golgi organization protein 2